MIIDGQEPNARDWHATMGRSMNSARVSEGSPSLSDIFADFASRSHGRSIEAVIRRTRLRAHIKITPRFRPSLTMDHHARSELRHLPIMELIHTFSQARHRLRLWARDFDDV